MVKHTAKLLKIGGTFTKSPKILIKKINQLKNYLSQILVKP